MLRPVGYRIKHRAEHALSTKNKEIEIKNEKIAVMNHELERKALRAQMDPHFIFNSLNSIQHFITSNDKSAALKYLGKFARLIRQVLENSVHDKVPIADEIKLLENYLALEAMRFSPKLEYSIEVDTAIDIHDQQIPFLLLQPYVENAVEHGLKYKEGGIGFVTVRIQQSNAHLSFTIEDNGVGRHKAMEILRYKKGDHESHGTTLTSRRMELLNRKQKATIKIEDLYDATHNAAGTKVTIDIYKELL